MQVVTLADLGSREHIFDATRPRCFETMVLCRLKGLYSDRPGPKYAVNDTAEYGDLKHTYDGDKDWKWWRPARAGQHVSGSRGCAQVCARHIICTPSNDAQRACFRSWWNTIPRRAQ